MTLYLDTSLLVTGLTTEPDGVRVEAWIRERTADDFVVSDWVVTEFSAALSRKLRAGQIDPDQRAVALLLFAEFCVDRAVILPVERQHFRTAARFADKYDTGIRAGDALHLAIASECGATLCTLDRRLGRAGPPLGVATLIV